MKKPKQVNRDSPLRLPLGRVWPLGQNTRVGRSAKWIMPTPALEENSRKEKEIMGTNYYIVGQKPCKTCGHSEERKHIGKSSSGWAFSLHIYPEEGIGTLVDWADYFLGLQGGLRIQDEYRRVLSTSEMMACITDRSHPDGLARADIDGTFCVGHEGETWDLIIGDFS